MLVLPASLLATDEPVSIEDTLQAAASEHCYQLTYQDGRFGGAAWERLLTQGQGAHFFLIGEEHGVAENARLASQLFAAL
ncbi:MAG: hypothetical protein HKN49_04075, partial [Gammaproteobacteria bacterium]|nr:hypothetical protein [Gammaproteobacteria bacterium]